MNVRKIGFDTDKSWCEVEDSLDDTIKIHIPKNSVKIEDIILPLLVAELSSVKE